MNAALLAAIAITAAFGPGPSDHPLAVDPGAIGGPIAGNYADPSDDIPFVRVVASQESWVENHFSGIKMNGIWIPKCKAVEYRIPWTVERPGDLGPSSWSGGRLY